MDFWQEVIFATPVALVKPHRLSAGLHSDGVVEVVLLLLVELLWLALGLMVLTARTTMTGSPPHDPSLFDQKYESVKCLYMAPACIINDARMAVIVIVKSRGCIIDFCSEKRPGHTRILAISEPANHVSLGVVVTTCFLALSHVRCQRGLNVFTSI